MTGCERGLPDDETFSTLLSYTVVTCTTRRCSRRACKGDESAFAELFGRYQRRIYQYASRMCGSAAGDDVVQTFLAVLTGRGRHSLPVAIHVASAPPYEPHVLAATLDARFFAELPARLIGDFGYDRDLRDHTSARPTASR
jgi:hypothetical protein